MKKKWLAAVLAGALLAAALLSGCSSVETVKRLRFGVGKTPELVLQQRGLTPESALETCMVVMDMTHRELEKLKKENAQKA